MSIDIKQVAKSALHHIDALLSEWLPGGEVRKGEYYVTNPRRNDAHKGSFSVSLSTGAFNDFADESSRGGDLVALYAWLHDCGQLDAAKAIAARIGMTGEPVKPLPAVRKIPEHEKKKNDIQPVWPAPFEAPPEIINSNRSGKPSQVYAYRDGQGRLMGYVCRFDSPSGRKDIKPLFWFGEKQWLWQGPKGDCPRPVYGLDRLAANPDKPVIIVEGEKAADAGQALLPDYVVISWLGGTGAVGKVPWASLSKRSKIIIWPDADEVGHKAAQSIAKILTGAKILKLPPDLPKAWDIADAKDLTEALRVLEFEASELRHQASKKQSDDAKFRYLGIRNKDGRCYYLIYDYASGFMLEYTASSLNWENLQELGGPDYWKLKYMGMESRRAIVDAAKTEIISQCKRRGVFDYDRLRGRGVWMDNGRPVAHIGNALLVDGGQQIALHELNGPYVYQQKTHIKLGGKPINTEDGWALVALCCQLSWEIDICGMLLAGWVFLAPVCGALKWRPHLWITGEAGSGKSWVFNEIISRALDNFSLKVQGETTEAGLRQYLSSDALPVIFDEAESETNASENRIRSILALTRQSSSSSGAKIVKGSAGGDSQTYDIRSMFAFVSILSGVNETSDAGRVSILNLTKYSDDAVKSDEHFKAISDTLHDLFTDEFISGLKMRAVTRLPMILASVDKFRRYAGLKLKSQRLGDQIGTLMAGMWALTHDEVPEDSEVSQLMDSGDWERFLSVTGGGASDSDKALSHLLSHVVRYGAEDYSVSELLEISQRSVYDDMVNIKHATATLSRYGLFIKDGHLRIANSNPQLKRLFKDTPWRGKWNDTLASIKGAVRSEKTEYMGNGHHPTRCLFLPLTALNLFVDRIDNLR